MKRPKYKRFKRNKDFLAHWLKRITGKKQQKVDPYLQQLIDDLEERITISPEQKRLEHDLKQIGTFKRLLGK